MNELKPYIGVTGISTQKEAKHVAQFFHQTLPEDSGHVGMMGYLVSRKTFQKEHEDYSKYPPIDSLPDMLSQSDSSILNTIHYRTDNKHHLSKQVIQLFKFKNILKEDLCNTVQLNVTNPSVQELVKIKDALPDVNIILPINQHALVSMDRITLFEKIGSYDELISYIILDPSGGIGAPFEADFIAPHFRLVRHRFPKLPIILGGGFNNQNISQRLKRLEFVLGTKNFGIDAEGGIRTNKTDDPHTGELSLQNTKEYISKAAEFFCSESA